MENKLESITSNKFYQLVDHKLIIETSEYIESNNIELKPSTKFDVIINNKNYPPKDFLRIAAKLKGYKIMEVGFTGGQANKPFEGLKYGIVQKLKSLKNEFAKWLLKNGANSYKDYYGNSTEEIIDKLDEIDSFFEIDIFKLRNNDYEKLKSFIADNIYGSNRENNSAFFDYDKIKGNGRPKAIIGKKNYFVFLEELNTEKNIKKELFNKYWAKYKEYFKLPDKEHSEKYKWPVLKQVYSKWDWDTENKPEMFKNAFEVNGPKNLWLSGNFYPIAHTSWMFENFEEETTGNFNNLFNESLPLYDRINSFINFYDLKLNDLKEQVPDKNINYHSHNDLRAIGLYLCLQYPEKYFLFKYGMVKKFCQKFSLPKIKAGDKNNLKTYLNISNEVLDLIKEDEEFLDEYKNFTNVSSNYEDKNLHLLTQDFIYTVANHFNSNINYWRIGSNDGKTSYYNNMLSEDYIAIGWNSLGDLSLKGIKSKNDIIDLLISINQYFKTNGVRSRKAGEIFDFYANAKENDIITLMDGNTVLAIGRIDGGYKYNTNSPFNHQRKVVWLKKNIKNFTISDGLQTTFYQLTNNTTINKINEFLMMKDISPTTEKKNSKQPLNQVLYGPPGTGKTYKTKELAVMISNPDFIYDESWSVTERREEILKEYERLCEKGQIVFTTFHQSMSYEDFVEGIKPKTENEKVTYEVEDGIFKEISLKASQKTISNFKDAYNQLLKEFSDNDNDFLILKTPKEKEFRVRLNSNNNLSLFTTNKSSQQGTFTKEKLEQHLYHENAFNGWEGYANAILNYLKENFKLNNKGINHRNYTLIIDEINRGNVSAVFGELITLLEDDKRIGQKEAIKITLPYSKDEFGVPSNLYIIGTMNTADRSVEALDTALRRRFSFTEVAPNSELLKDRKVEEIALKTLLQTINDRIELLIDKDHKIGHSYFLNIETLENLKQTFKNKVIPLLEEYFFGDYGKIGLVLGDDFIKLKEDEDKVSFAKNFTEKYEDAENLREKAVYTFTDEDSWRVSSFISIYEQ